MNWQEAVAEIKRRGTEWLTRDKSGKGYVCPICGSGSGRNGTGITTKDGEHFTCWAGCFTNASILDIIAIHKGIDIKNFPAVLRAACGEFGIDFDGLTNDMHTGGKDYEERRAAQAKAAKEKQERAAAERAAFVEKKLPEIKERALRDIAPALDYLKSRGISEETARRHEIGFLKPFVVKGNYQWMAGGVLFFHDDTFEARNMDSNAEKGKRYCRPAGQPPRMWNFAAIEKAAIDGDADARPVFVVEGIMDALSVEEAGGVAVALNSTANAAMFAEELARRDVDKLPPVILSLDNDESGETATKKLADALTNKGIFFLQANLCDVGGEEAKPKDANEALQRNRGQFIANVKQAAQKAVATFDEWRNKDREEYENESLFVQVSDFLYAIDKKRERWSTGFTWLDAKLRGGLYPGLFLLGAPTGVGKTAFALQMTAQIAAAGGDALYFSLEISREELMARELSRHSYLEAMKRDGENNAAMGHLEIMDGGIPTTGSKFELLHRAYVAISEYALRIHTITGVGDVTCWDVRAAVQRHIKLTGKKPAVVVDYLQIIQSTGEKKGIKENIDYNVLELKRISRDLDLPVLAISAFNRTSAAQTNPTLAAFRESSSLEYTCDSALILKPDYTDALKKQGLTDKEINSLVTEGTSQEAQSNRFRLKEIGKERRRAAENGQCVPVMLEILKGRSTGEAELPLDFFPKFGLYRERAMQVQ